MCVGLDYVTLLDRDPELRLELDPRNIPGALQTSNNDHVPRRRAHAGLRRRITDCRRRTHPKHQQSARPGVWHAGAHSASAEELESDRLAEREIERVVGRALVVGAACGCEHVVVHGVDFPGAMGRARMPAQSAADIELLAYD